MVSSSNPDAVIDRVGTKVSLIANEIAGCARVEETGVPWSRETGQNLIRGLTISHSNHRGARQVIITSCPHARKYRDSRHRKWRNRTGGCRYSGRRRARVSRCRGRGCRTPFPLRRPPMCRLLASHTPTWLKTMCSIMIGRTAGIAVTKQRVTIRPRGIVLGTPQAHRWINDTSASRLSGSTNSMSIFCSRRR